METTRFFRKEYFMLPLFLLILNNPILCQQKQLPNLIGQGFDIRYVDALDWLSSSKGKQLIRGNTRRTSINARPTESFHFITSPYDFEKQILNADALSKPYQALNSKAHYKGFNNDKGNKTLLVYTKKQVPLSKNTLVTAGSTILDSAMVEDFKRLGRDITPEGFIDRYGTHYAHEVTLGGTFLKRNLITNDDFIYSPYDQNQFKEKVIEEIKTSHQSQKNRNPYITTGSGSLFTRGGDTSKQWFTDWQTTLENNVTAIDVSLEPWTIALKKVDFQDLQDKEKRIQLLDSVIELAINGSKKQLHAPQSSQYFTKYSLRFKQSIDKLIKKSAGATSSDEHAYTGDLFFGGFSKDEAMLRTAPLIDRGGIRLETLITDEEIKLNKQVLITVKPEDLERGYVSVWDDTKKLVKSKERKRLRVSGPEKAKTFYKEALTKDIYKDVEITTIDGDIYEVTYVLSLEKEKKLLENSGQHYNTALQTEIVRAASIGDLARMKILLTHNATRRIPGLIAAIITSKQSSEILNYVLDKGLIPSSEDLELLFLKEYFDEQKILILLERGAPFKNNMIYKAVAYQSDPIIYALLREGATPVNNDLSFALETYHYPSVKALMSVDFDAFEAGKKELALAVKNNDADLAEKFTTLGATADASLLDSALRNGNNELKNIIIPVTEANENTLKVSSMLDNTELFKYFINKNASITSNKIPNTATDNNNFEILDISLKNGGNASELLEYAIKKENKKAIQVALNNKAQPDSALFYAAQKDDAELFNDVLNLYEGNPDVAMTAAIKENNLPFAESVIAIKKEDMNVDNLLPLAVAGENVDMVKLLVSNNSNPSKGINKAITIENKTISQYLISMGADTTDPLLIESAITNENLGLVELLVNQGGINLDNALLNATETQNIEIVNSLLDSGAKANEALANAMETKNEPLILLLMDHVSSLEGDEFIRSAARKGNLTVLKRLLSNGANPTLAIEDAIRYKMIGSLKILLQSGAKCDQEHLRIAIDYYFTEGVLMLLNRPEVDLNIAFTNGSYPIHTVSRSLNVDSKLIMKNLIELGAQVNIEDHAGDNALHILASQNEYALDIIELLLENGADPNHRNEKDKKPIDYALNKITRSAFKKAMRAK